MAVTRATSSIPIDIFGKSSGIPSSRRRIDSEAFLDAADLLAAVAASDTRIATKRLRLEPLERGHAQELFPVLSDAALYAYTGGGPPASMDELRSRYARLEARRSPDGSELWLNWVLREAVTGTTLGYVQATVTGRHADVAWVVGASWQHRGYATEAAQALLIWLRRARVTVVRAKIHPRHAASRRVAANIGLLHTTEVIDGEDVWVSRG